PAPRWPAHARRRAEGVREAVSSPPAAPGKSRGLCPATRQRRAGRTTVAPGGQTTAGAAAQTEARRMAGDIHQYPGRPAAALRPRPFAASNAALAKLDLHGLVFHFEHCRHAGGLLLRRYPLRDLSRQAADLS